MKIRCIANTGESLPDKYIDPPRGYTEKIKLALTIGKEYVVYAIREWKGTIWYYSGETQVCIKFCPDEPAKQKSPLDDIRQSEEYKELSNNNWQPDRDYNTIIDRTYIWILDFKPQMRADVRGWTQMFFWDGLW